MASTLVHGLPPRVYAFQPHTLQGSFHGSLSRFFLCYIVLCVETTARTTTSMFFFVTPGMLYLSGAISPMARTYCTQRAKCSVARYSMRLNSQLRENDTLIMHCSTLNVVLRNRSIVKSPPYAPHTHHVASREMKQKNPSHHTVQPTHSTAAFILSTVQ